MPKVDPPKKPWNWRLWVRCSMWAAVCAGVAWGGVEVRSFLNADSRFALTRIEVQGAVYAQPDKIRAVFVKDVNSSIFAIPLVERRRHLLAVDWVQTASVTRIWPDRLIVKVTERRPVAFARMPTAGSTRHWLTLIDAEGVLLSIPPKVRFRLPVMSGVTEEQTEQQRCDRVEAVNHLLADLGPQARDISEVNAANLQEMKVIAYVQGRGYELWLGDQHFRSRYANFISHFSDIRRHSENASAFDLRDDDRILAKQ
jgi:cell division protein FtsQ